MLLKHVLLFRMIICPYWHKKGARGSQTCSEYWFWFGLFFKLNAGCKGFTKWFDRIRRLVSGLVTIIGKSMGNSTANIQCCSNLGKMLFVHFLRLLYAFQTNIRQMLNTCWQTLACKQGRISRRQRPNVWFQSGTRTVTCQGRWWDEQLITTISLINLKLPWQKSRSHPLSNVAQRYPLSRVRKAISKMEILSFQVN